MIFTYYMQTCNVKWNNDISRKFSIGNGVKQGSVISPILFCFYINDLFKDLRKTNIGCWLHGFYVGIIGYADDLLLLCPSLEGLQIMIKACEDYALKHNLQFSTDSNISKCKTKCMAFNKNNIVSSNMLLNGTALPWVSNCKYLGFNINNHDNYIKLDINCKKNEYIRKNIKLIHEFYYAHPVTVFTLNKVYNTSFYGSQVWNLFSKESNHVFNAWNVSVREMYKLPRNSHRYLLEPLAETAHIKFNLYKRFIKFCDTLNCSNKLFLKSLYSKLKFDVNSIIGNNLRKIMLELDLGSINDINCGKIDCLNYVEIPGSEYYRIDLLKDLINIRAGNDLLPGFSYDEIQTMIDYVAIS